MAWKRNIYILSTTLLLVVSHGQEISPNPIEGRVGENVTIMCRGRFANEAVNNILQVERPSGALESFLEAPEVAGRIFRLTDVNDLTTYSLGPLMPNDNGTVLVCSVDTFNSNRSTVTVVFTAIITRTPENIQSNPVIVREGQTVQINLNIMAYPQPSGFMWSRGGVEVSSGNGLTLARDSFLANPTNKEHSGTYVLAVTNSAGVGYYNFTLDVQFPPEFPSDHVTPTNSNCTLGNNNCFICASIPETRLEFICNVTGNPTPSLNHSFSDGTPTVSAVGNIVIDPVMSSSAGNYSCVTSSSAFPQSSSTRRFELYVGGPPQPLNTVVPRINVEKDIITFTWSYNDSVNNVPILNFVATISQNGQAVRSYTLSSRNRSLSVALSMLMAGQTYTIDVVVRNLQGDSVAISQIFNVPTSNSIVIAASYLLSLMLFVMVVLLN